MHRCAWPSLDCAWPSYRCAWPSSCIKSMQEPLNATESVFHANGGTHSLWWAQHLHGPVERRPKFDRFLGLADRDALHDAVHRHNVRRQATTHTQQGPPAPCEPAPAAGGGGSRRSGGGGGGRRAAKATCGLGGPTAASHREPKAAARQSPRQARPPPAPEEMRRSSSDSAAPPCPSLFKKRLSLKSASL